MGYKTTFTMHGNACIIIMEFVYEIKFIKLDYMWIMGKHINFGTYSSTNKRRSSYYWFIFYIFYAFLSVQCQITDIANLRWTKNIHNIPHENIPQSHCIDTSHSGQYNMPQNRCIDIVQLSGQYKMPQIHL